MRIKNSVANQTYDVVVNGNSVGQITTDDSGGGEFKLTNPSFDVQSGSTLAVNDSLGNLLVGGTFGAI